MRLDETREEEYLSTTRGVRRVRLGLHPQGTGQRGEATPPRRRRRRQLTEPLTLTVTFAGGAEGSWVLKDPGHRWRYPGHWALHDVLAHWYSIR